MAQTSFNKRIQRPRGGLEDRGEDAFVRCAEGEGGHGTSPSLDDAGNVLIRPQVFERELAPAA